MNGKTQCGTWYTLWTIIQPKEWNFDAPYTVDESQIHANWNNLDSKGRIFIIPCISDIYNRYIIETKERSVVANGWEDSEG